MKDNIFRISVCPRCGQTYTAPPATARDGSGPICPDCGTREALPEEMIYTVLHQLFV